MSHVSYQALWRTLLVQVQDNMATGQLSDPVGAAPTAETLPWQLMVAERARTLQSALLSLQVTALFDRLSNYICGGAQVVKVLSQHHPLRAVSKPFCCQEDRLYVIIG